MHRRATSALLACCGLLFGRAAAAENVMTVETPALRLTIDAQARVTELLDRAAGVNHVAAPQPMASVRVGGKDLPATKAALQDGVLNLSFGTAATARLKLTPSPRAILVELLGAEARGAETLTFISVPTNLTAQAGEPFAACAVALNLKTRVPEIPGPSRLLRAITYPQLGFAGAKVALVGVPTAELRPALKEVVAAAPDMPHSPIGGPCALDGPLNNGSYLFNFTGIAEADVDRWIALAKSLGITQIDFHGGTSFRFGDFLPNPKVYPNAAASMKAVNDKLHAAGIQAGLHTYAMFIDKTASYVTPVPDPRLGKDATLTLAADLPADAKTVPVTESTAGMSAVTGFFVRNSATVQIDDELIVYTGVAKEAPFGFTGCTRGACGTKVTAHAAGAKVQHLRECFGRFVPDGESTLLEEVAAKTAQLYNDAGFDMIYLDALDGEDTVAGPALGWHYGAKFAWAIFGRLDKPAIMEMSTFHHHLWSIRSRMNAWDHPNRSYKHFVDLHVASNDEYRRQFLPGHLGWWAFETWQGADTEPTLPDDIEYLCAKAIGTDTGLSIMGIDPDNVGKVPAVPRLAAIVRDYEALRHGGKVPAALKAQLREPGKEFTLLRDASGKPQFAPVVYGAHTVEALAGPSAAWPAANPHPEQPLRFRLQPLLGAGAYDGPHTVVAGFTDAAEFTVKGAAQGVTAQLTPSTAQVKAGRVSGLLTATNAGTERRGAWAKVGKVFAPPANLGEQRATGLWIYGDGKGELLNVQFTSPSHLSHGIADHYVTIDFTGWRYVELVEPEGKRYADYVWPYGNIYSMYREPIRHDQVETLTLWLNDLPPKETVTLYVSPIHALPIAKTVLRKPAVTVNGRTLVCDTTLESGQVLEYSPDGAHAWGPQGEDLGAVPTTGAPGVLKAGDNAVAFAAETDAGSAGRTRVTVISRGEPIPAE